MPLNFTLAVKGISSLMLIPLEGRLSVVGLPFLSSCCRDINGPLDKFAHPEYVRFRIGVSAPFPRYQNKSGGEIGFPKPKWKGMLPIIPKSNHIGSTNRYLRAKITKPAKIRQGMINSKFSPPKGRNLRFRSISLIKTWVIPRLLPASPTQVPDY